ncbi:hypothetical protein GGE68_000990 [Rhizobium leguminosarum]|uniref:hypothetical protein n=1 Tax=Rhizobium leguminosarum TaxID=384 RepID=UPI00161BFD80|nr:hypothetical protein [Rhizobium leguminosarum]MBB5662818.1 hypothetical protein [Rhizobium leguminosarum]
MSFSEEQLSDEINESWTRMSFKQRYLWEAIKRPPEQWQLRGYGSCWTVALIGSTVIYYNQFEHGFNASNWFEHGVIAQYQSLNWGLEDVLQRQLDIINSGYDVGPWASPPIAGEYPNTSR